VQRRLTQQLAFFIDRRACFEAELAALPGSLLNIGPNVTQESELSAYRQMTAIDTLRTFIMMPTCTTMSYG
jgi:hypothetical protein